MLDTIESLKCIRTNTVALCNHHVGAACNVLFCYDFATMFILLLDHQLPLLFTCVCYEVQIFCLITLASLYTTKTCRQELGNIRVELERGIFRQRLEWNYGEELAPKKKIWHAASFTSLSTPFDFNIQLIIHKFIYVFWSYYENYM